MRCVTAPIRREVRVGEVDRSLFISSFWDDGDFRFARPAALRTQAPRAVCHWNGPVRMATRDEISESRIARPAPHLSSQEGQWRIFQQLQADPAPKVQSPDRCTPRQPGQRAWLGDTNALTKAQSVTPALKGSSSKRQMWASAPSVHVPKAPDCSTQVIRRRQSFHQIGNPRPDPGYRWLVSSRS